MRDQDRSDHETIEFDIEHERPGSSPHRRSLVTELLTLQLAIAGSFAIIALAGLAWTSGGVMRNNLELWAQQWAEELNELGAPFYRLDSEEAVLDVERFIAKYPEIDHVTWYGPAGAVLASINKNGSVDAPSEPLAEETVAVLAEKAGVSPAYMLRENIERNRRFRLSGPIWVESFTSDGLFGLDPSNLETNIDLIGFVSVDLDFSAYQSAFTARLLLASLALAGLLFLCWVCERALLRRALGPLSELEQPLQEIAAGKLQVEFPTSRHKETEAIVTALRDTLLALEKREQHLLHLANHDPLTGLYSRHRLTTELEAEIATCESGQKRSALCFVDLDQFKYINDTCGHPAGDQLLRLAAEQLRHSVRTEDFVARFGGDEFVVLLRNVSRRQAGGIANQILNQMRRLCHVEGEQVFHLQCSIGVTAVNSTKFNPHELIAQADMACQTAKAHGRNRVEFYKIAGKQNERMMEDIRWMQVIREALEKDSFVLHYQPLLHIASGEVSDYEALLRLKTDKDLIGPQTFLPAANRFGLTGDIDVWVVEHAIRFLAEMEGNDPKIRLLINLSSFAFENETFASGVRRLLRDYSVPGDRIVFEITEQMAVRFAVQTDKQISMLRDLGCSIAIDDFGTGYSSFSYLKHLPVDCLKIDGSFVREITRNPVDQSMVRMVGEVARAAGMQTVAEHVEDADTLELLRKFGIDYAQGYYIGRPVPKPPQIALAAHRFLRKARQPEADSSSLVTESKLR